MLSNKLISLLKTFSKYDLNRFRKYLSSPFYNDNVDLINLFELLNKYLRLNEGSQKEKLIEKKIIWSKLFPKKAYRDVKLRRLCSDMIKLAFSFLAHKVYKNKPQKELLHLLHALNDPSLTKQFESVLKQTELLQQKSTVRDSDYHYFQFVIEQNRYRYEEQTRGSSLAGLEQSDFQLDCFYFSKKLRNLCDALSYKHFLSSTLELKSIPGFLKHLEENGFTDIPAIKVYYLVAKMLIATEGEVYFFQLKEFIYKYDFYFSKAELNTLFIHLKNYCILKKINNGRQEFQYELFSIYKISLEKKIIINGNILDLHHYKNIITIGLLVQEYAWVENFIQKYTNSLPKEHRENAYTYNFAKVYFSQKKYTKVIEQLREVKYKNHIYALGGKLILLKTYYELKEYQALDSLIDSFRIYVRRNKLISRDVKQQYLNMLRFVKKLSSIIAGDKKALDKVKIQIDKCKALAGKKWILEKVEELA